MTSPKYADLPKHLCYSDTKGFYFDFRESGGGRRVRKVLGFTTKAFALEKHAKFYEQLVNGTFGLKPKLTFREAAQSFLQYSMANKRSWKDDEWRLRELVDFFGDKPAEQINLNLVEGYRSGRKQKFSAVNERSMADSSMNKELACLKAVINRAFKNGDLEKNPIAGLKLAKENNQRNVTLEQEQYSKLLDCSPKHLVPIVKLAYLTGMRYSEIIGLEWGKVDFQKRLITIEAENTKTNERRQVPMSQTLVDELLALPEIEGCTKVFTYKGKPLLGVRTAFKASCRRAGITGFRFHDLRHCAVTNLRKSGVQDNVTMAITGHKTTSMFRRYDRIDEDDKRQAVAKVGHFLDTLASEKQKVA